MDMGFAANGPLARRLEPPIRFLFIGPRVCSALPSDPTSRRRPCASLALHLHQVGQGTLTPKLSDMLGTPLRIVTFSHDSSLSFGPALRRAARAKARARHARRTLLGPQMAPAAPPTAS